MPLSDEINSESIRRNSKPPIQTRWLRAASSVTAQALRLGNQPQFSQKGTGRIRHRRSLSSNLTPRATAETACLILRASLGSSFQASNAMASEIESVAPPKRSNYIFNRLLHRTQDSQRNVFRKIMQNKLACVGYFGHDLLGEVACRLGSWSIDCAKTQA